MSSGAGPTVLVKKADGTTERVPLSSLKKNAKRDEEQANQSKAPTGQPKTAASKISLPPKSEKQVTSSKPTFVETHSDQAPISQKTKSTPQTFLQPKKERIEDAPPNAVRVASKQAADTPAESPLQHEHSVKRKQDTQAESTKHLELSTTTPVDDYFIDLAKAHEWTKHDHASPLEASVEKEMAGHEEKSALPHSRFDDVEKVIASIDFQIPKELHSRLHSLIQSRVKDVRSDEQIVIYAMRESAHGGLGLPEVDARNLVDVIHKTLAVKRKKDIPGPRKTIHKPELVAPPRPSSSVRDGAQSTVAPMPSAGPKQSVSLKDIHPPQKLDPAMGPVDEIGSMTLVDFRRLSQDPHSAIEVLRDKIDTIRNDSYLEYVKAQEAWYKSPLYQVYLAHLGKALEKPHTLRDVLGEDLTAEDISVISTFSESLRF